ERASLSTSAGLVKSEFARSTLTQVHTLTLLAGSPMRSADLHVSASSIGEFIPDGGSRDFLATGSARFIGERSTVTTTARYFMQEAGSASSPLIARPSAPAMTTGTGTRRFMPQDTLPQSIQQYTLGSTATFIGDDRWTHSLTAGVDGYRLANVRSNATPIPSVALQDSALRAAQGTAARGTLRATSTLSLGNPDSTRATLTFAAEHGLFRSVSAGAVTETVPQVAAPTLGKTTTMYAAPPSTVNWQSSTSFTTEANASLDNTYFVTAGVRLERDSRLTGSQLAALPMLGAATVRDIGPLTVKLRGSYGEGIRPPSTFARAVWPGAFGLNSQQELGAEKQVGTELGLDLMLRRALSLRVTRFDQRASGLIQLVGVPGDTASRTHRVRYDLENLGEISNRGWELESSMNVSRLTLSATLSLVKSRVEKVAEGYKGDLIAGDRMLLVPARTGGVSASWLGRNWSASLGASRALDWINYDELGMSTDYLSGEHSAYDFTGQRLRQYWRRYNGALRVRASLSRDIRDMFTFEVSGDNLLDYQRNEPDNLTVLPGRTITTGMKVRF
ncbi:MAG TPA: TonB-dependent receptor, partial [Gemmatimonadaceae bacterium]